MDRAKIFQSVIKGTNVFTPIIDSYHTVGNHIIELVFPSNNSYKESSTKEGSNSKAIAKRRKRNNNKKTHRNAKR